MNYVNSGLVLIIVSSVVVSVFAIIILSVIGALFKVRQVHLQFYFQHCYPDLLLERATVTTSRCSWLDAC